MDVLNKKWEALRRRARIFKYIPFIDFVLVAGSMAFGNAKEDSDFDVIVGVRHGRIFTARFFCWLIFGIFGWRAKHALTNAQMIEDRQQATNYKNHKVYNSYKDKFCFNHFVTEKSYQLSPPYNEYWKKLYQNLAPIYGNKNLIKKFQKINLVWAGNITYKYDYYIYRKASFVKTALEWLLNSFFGKFWEKILKKIQIKKIEKSIKNEALGYKPRIKYSDDELEFHPDTSRTFSI